MSTPAQIRAALAAQITANVTATATVPALRGLLDPSTIANPPVAVVLPPLGTYIDYTVAMPPNVYEITIRVLILVSRAVERAWLPVLDAYLEPYGASSVAAAILADPTLGGVTDYCIPQVANGPADFNWAGIDYLSAEIVCTAGAE